MGRILRKKRVSNEDSENLVTEISDQLPLKSSEALLVDDKTVSCPKTLERTALMDKTNSLKPKGRVTRNVAQPKPEDAENTKNPVVGGKAKRIARRRKSSKENYGGPKDSSEVDAKSKPLGDKTNVSEAKSASPDRTEAEETHEANLAKTKQTSSESEVPEKVLSAIALRKLPPRNASKFEDGWISALRRSRSSKESNAEPQKTSSKAESAQSLHAETAVENPKRDSRISRESDLELQKTSHEKAESESVPLPCGESAIEKSKRVRRILKNSDTEPQKYLPVKALSESVQSPCAQIAVEKPKRGRRGGKVAKNQKELSPFEETKTRKSPRNRNDVEEERTAPKDYGAKKQEPDENSSKPEKESNDADVTPTSVTSQRKPPPRNAAKYEKGWVSSAPLKQRTSEDNGDPQKSSSSPKHHEADEIGKTDISKDVERRSESAEEEKVAPNRSRSQPVRRKNLDSTAQEIKSIDNDCAKTLKPVVSESVSRGLNSFESRIAAKLGKDMCGSVFVDKPKTSAKSRKKTPPKQTCSRMMRKRGGKDKIPSPSKNIYFEKSTPCDLPKSSPATEDTPLGKANLRSTDDVEKPTNCDKNHSKTVTSCSSKAPIYEPKPGCSRDSEFVTPLRKSPSSKSPKISPSAPPKAPSSSLFSIFKKPETPRRNAIENKIFLSASKPHSPIANKLPVYGDPNMTPLKKTSTLPRDMKEELYDFEVDENEPKPKKRHKPIMKIQRIRAVKRKKPKVYEADPETERRVLKNLDLSPSLFKEFRAAKKMKLATPSGVVSQVSQSAHPAEAAGCAEADNLNFDMNVEPMSSPCRDYGQSTPMRTDAPSMFMDGSEDKFGRLSAKVYSPVKTKDSPIPILMSEYNNDHVRRDGSSRQSVVSNTSCASGASGNSIYHDDLDISASTPVKFNKNCSRVYVHEKRKPVELNVSNCFGFDEPELVEEPLVSPIKSSPHVPVNSAPAAPPARPVPILKSKPPVMLPPPETPAVDVEEVIKQLRFEVGDNASANASANLSVYDDSEITLKSKSPIKRYFQPTNEKRKAHAADVSSLDDGDASLSPIPAPSKVPRLSYERPNKLRKQKVVQPMYKESSEIESADESEASDVDEPAEETAEPVEQTFKPTKYLKKEAPKKKEKGMTKKEKEELEKWAHMFNSQCDQISSLDLVVE